MWIQDEQGNLIFYNEPAESLIGSSFDDVGEINASDLAEVFVTTDLDGNPIPAEELPVVIALTERVPAHGAIRYRALDGTWREIELTALPIEGQGGRHLGVLAAFWEGLAP